MPTRVLVVDDDARLLRTLTVWLMALGYESLGVATVAGALIAMQRASFDLAIVDLQLPDGNGIDLVVRLKQHDPRLVCLMLTGHATVDSAVAALRHGLAFDFLQKPLGDPDTLAKSLAEALQHRQALLPLSGTDPSHGLTERESEILDLLAQGMPNRDIASRTGISDKTVRNHLTTIYRKLGVDSRTQALVIYQQWRSRDG